MNTKLLAIDVPPTADLGKVEEVFDDALASNVFAYQTLHRFVAESNLI
jgi:hypothetical protein